MEVDDQRTQQLGYYKFQSNGITREFEDKESGEKMKTIKNPNFINGGFNNPSSRIIRVSRATGGKDRHSKVWTSKGLRDRRVRLSVPTAIQFYDLQDRLGFDQPSKAVEWLINAAADSISNLPSLKNTPFPDSEKLMAIHNESIIVDGTSMSKSACSSNSEPDPGSDPSLSRSEIRDRARERAKVRRKEKEKEKELGFTRNQTFTELLTGSINANQENPVRETGSVHQNPARNWISSTGPGTGPLDYFSSELETVSMQMPHHHDHHHHHEMAFIPDHPITMAMPGGGGSYNHDFNIMCFNRGTLQSNNNSPQTFFSTLQRFSSDGGSGGTPPFLMAASPPENLHHHQFQFYYDNGCKNSDSKGKSKN